MDDVDAAESLQAKNMLLSGDWVTQRLNGTLYLDKAPLKYWLTASLYRALGVHAWVSRLPTALAVVVLCLLVTQIGGFYAGLILSTSLGLYLFTRTVIPDALLTLFITAALWCFFRLCEDATHSLAWATGMYASIACAILTKGLIGVLFPAAIALVYLVITRTRPRLHLIPGLLLLAALAGPWHLLAILHNPPTLDLTLNPGPHFRGRFRGFFWFYFINEQLLRFLNLRWPHDYNTVPRAWFWAYHILWFFPWSFALPALLKLKLDRLRLLALCWVGVILLFFTFSTTQEYYSMPAYPAIAILLAAAVPTARVWLKLSAAISIAAAAFIALILLKVWSLPAPGDIYKALTRHPDLYTLSLGHLADLTLPACAYLKLPLEIAGLAFLIGGLGVWFSSPTCGPLVIAVMLTAFFQAARLALIVFDPYLSSYVIAEKLNHLPPGTVVAMGKYNPLSSVFFYSRDRALQNNPDLDILEYGSLAPGAPEVLISDNELKSLWRGPGLVYLIAKAPRLPHLDQSHLILQSADKYLFANHLTP